MKKAERIANAKEMYIDALIEKRLAENGYRNIINDDGADNVRRFRFREDWKEKSAIVTTLYKVFIKFNIVSKEELEEIEASI